ASQECSSVGTLQPMSFTIVATNSPSPVTWKATAVETIPNTRPWASIAPASDTTPAGKTEPFTVTPASNVCQTLAGSSKIFHITVTVVNGQSTSIAITISPFIIP